LDKFVFKFIKILKKHTDYVIVSGYVAILLGRNRATDDIDIIIPKTDKEKFELFYNELLKEGFWCINTDELSEIYDILISKHSVRFAIKDVISPNIEIKFSRDDLDLEALKNKIKIQINDHILNTSILELQVAYKEEILKSNKDMEDAEHIRNVCRENLNTTLINEYKKRLRLR